MGSCNNSNPYFNRVKQSLLVLGMIPLNAIAPETCQGCCLRNALPSQADRFSFRFSAGPALRWSRIKLRFIYAVRSRKNYGQGRTTKPDKKNCQRRLFYVLVGIEVHNVENDCWTHSMFLRQKITTAGPKSVFLADTANGIVSQFGPAIGCACWMQ